MRAILRENGIAIEEMAVPRKHYIIRIPVVGRLTATSLREGVNLNDADEISMSIREYEFEYERNGTLFYELRKESKKMSTCGCVCDKKEYHLCYCVDDRRCTCVKRKCCRKDDKPAVYKYYLIGFKYEDSKLTQIDSSGFKNGEEVLLHRAEAINRRDFYNMKILAVDIDMNTIYCKEISLKETVKATLC